LKDLKISLAAARVNAGMIQQEAADKLHVSKVTIGNWESGKTKVSFADLSALSKIYKVPIDNIFLPYELT